MEYYKDEALHRAIDELIAQMTRVESRTYFKREAREVLARTVENLLRDVGTVDPPPPRL